MDHELSPYRAPAEGETGGRRPSGDTAAAARLWSVLSANAPLIAACTAVVVATTGLVTWRLTPTYEASASIRIAQDDARLEPFTTAPAPAVGPNELPTEFQVLQSRTLSEAVVDSLRLQVELRKPATVSREELFLVTQASRDALAGQYRLVRGPDGRFNVRDRTSGTSLGTVPIGARLDLHGVTLQLAPTAARYPVIEVDVYAFDEAVARLQRAVKVRRRSPEANILDVSFAGPDPWLVQQVPNVLTARFVLARQDDRHAQARSAAEFLSGQVAKLSDELSASEDSVRSFEERNRVVSLPEEAGTGLTQTAELQAKRDGIEAERSALAALVRSIGDSLQRDPTTGVLAYRNLVAFPTLLQNNALTQLLSSLAVVEDHRSDLLSRRSPDDQDVQVLTARANQLGAQLGAIALVYLQGLANQVSALDSVLARSRQQLDRIPAKELEFARRQRETKGLEGIVTLLQSRLKEAEIAQAVEDPSVRLLDAAILPRKPVSPRPLLNLCLAFVFGMGLGCAGAFVREYLDGTVRSRHDVLTAAGVPVLGLLPHADGAAAVEAYNLLGTNLTFAVRDTSARVFAITSALPGEGKTTVAVNLARTLAQRGLRVLLVDGDLRQGTISTVLGIPRAPGLADVLGGMVQFATAASGVWVSGTGSLRVLSRGRACENPLALLDSKQATTLLRSLRDDFDLIIVDCPPANVVADTSVIAMHSDAVIIVARAAITDLQALVFARDQLARVSAPLVGAVLNDIDFRRDAAYDGAYRYYARAYLRPRPLEWHRFLPFRTPEAAIADCVAAAIGSSWDDAAPG
jgi:succinoglycan biosynthesis transport protein ExoP